MPRIRAFIAIELPQSLQQKLAGVQEELRPLREHISWTKTGNIHFTLKFLGEVESDKIPGIAVALNGIAGESASFAFSVRAVGAFPSIKRARVLWAGIADDTGGLSDLAKKIDEALIHFGFSRENRKFAPHLTLGRVKAPLSNSFIQVFQQLRFDGGDVAADRIVLFKSDLKPTGAIYSPLAIFMLK